MGKIYYDCHGVNCPDDCFTVEVDYFKKNCSEQFYTKMRQLKDDDDFGYTDDEEKEIGKELGLNVTAITVYESK